MGPRPIIGRPFDRGVAEANDGRPAGWARPDPAVTAEADRGSPAGRTTFDRGRRRERALDPRGTLAERRRGPLHQDRGRHADRDDRGDARIRRRNVPVRARHRRRHDVGAHPDGRRRRRREHREDGDEKTRMRRRGDDQPIASAPRTSGSTRDVSRARRSRIRPDTRCRPTPAIIAATKASALGSSEPIAVSAGPGQ